MSNNSDYKKPYTNLFELLPKTLQTEVNQSILENVFNRFLTKSESKYVFGTIGKKSTRVLNDNRLIEPTVHRQGFQLQPLIYKKIASIDHIVSFYDILQKAERLGIDKQKIPQWGNTEQFNFAPPIDFDKLINWNNYYWYDPSGSSTPEYITIKNICTVFQSRVNLKQRLHTDLITGGQATAEEIAVSAVELSYWETLRDCFCYNSNICWDNTLWNGNPPGWITTINSSNIAPSSPDIGDLWFDSIQQKLKYYDGTQWIIFPIDYLVSGVFVWNSSINFYEQPNNDWSRTNKWLHRNDVPNFTLAKRAEMPIIEYNPFLELNNWSYTKHVWAYRKNKFHKWEIVDVEPSIYEIGTKFKVTQVTTTNEIAIQQDHSSILSTGKKIKITVLPSLTQFVFTVDSIIDSNSQQTYFSVFESTISLNLLLNNSSNSAVCEILLEETSLGDQWEGFFKHWALVETKDPVPVNKQKRPTNIIKDVDEIVITPKNIFPLNKTFLVNQNVIRVYINQRRQYGNYEEGWYDGSVFTSVNDSNYHTIIGTNGGIYGNAIRFNQNIQPPSSITIETEPAAESDIFYKEVVVRTSLDDDFETTDFETEVKTLIKYRLVEQNKNYPNQYPLFDIFHVDGTTAYEANCIFAFEESPDYPVNPKIGKRIKITKGGKEYHFEQFLIKEDNGELFCYKDKWSIEQFSNPEGLQTIWRTNIPATQYVPRYVNEYRLADGDTYIDFTNTLQTAHVPYGKGDWEIVDQFFYNPHHENRKKLKFSELYAHFNSIVQKQQLPPGFEKAKTETYYLLDKPNYGVGGTIKEFNDNFDLFISSMLQTVATPRTIIDFAQKQYESNLKLLKDLCIQHIVDLITSYDSEALTDLYSFISKKIITLFEQNDVLDFTFGDSTTYDTKTGKGIKNWIITLPYLGLVTPVEPVLLIDKNLGFIKILHHDGHLSTISIDKKIIEILQQKIIKITQVNTGARPNWDVVRRGEFWYDTITKKLYRFSVVSTESTPPSVNFPIGSYWLNQSTGILYVRDDSTSYGWSPVNNIVGDVDVAWKFIDFDEIVATVIYNVEKKLYEAVPYFEEKTFDFNSLLTTPQLRETFVNHLKEHFFEYVQTVNADFFSSKYDPSNPFTWNYIGFIDSNIIPPVKRGSNEPAQWSGTWEGIYEANFGTRYPHLMPWKLQGYTNKPSWWDAEYKDTTGSRRWKSIMWINIENGIIPSGYPLPDGMSINDIPKYNFICVDKTTDTLLPPYVEGSNDTFFNNFSNHIAPYISTLRKPFTFGELGFVEMQWRDSTFFYYALLHIAFKMQPVRFLQRVFGPKFIKVAHLQINEKTKKVFSHKDTEFHGEIDEKTNTTIVCNGLNQWYINFIRYNNYDINISDFKELWTNWETFLSYQTGSVINASSMQISTKNYSLTERDYNVVLKKTLNLKDYWIDCLLVTVHNPGSDWTVRNNHKVPRYDGLDWEFRVDIPSTLGRKIKYYGIKRYACSFDPSTDQGTLTGNVFLPWAQIDNEKSNMLEEINYISDDTLTWYTGFPVQISSTGGFPVPLKPDTTYYIIKIDNKKFKLANSYNEAVAGIAIDIETSTSSTLYVEEVLGTFVATNGSITSRTWKHYGIDKRQINEVYMPSIFIGVQTLINLIDGYASYLKDQGWIFNDPDIVEIDIETNQPLSWQVEIERLINRIYSGLGRNIYQTDDVNLQDYPIKPYHEVNPFRNNLWFRTNNGIISNILTGSYTDIRTGTTIYDQTGNPLPLDSIFVFRTDKKTHLRTCSLSGSKYGQNALFHSQQNVENVKSYSVPHLAGAHIFIDGYEHVIVFNKQTVDNQLIYNPFLGLSINKFTVSFEKGNDFTFKPNIGGFYLLNNQLIQNIEQSVENIQYYYDTYKVNETVKFIDYARSLLGYNPPNYLDSVNANSKSKFVFWKGMIQNKGSVNSIKAFINARLFVDAKVDEFWAYRVAEYGNKTDKKYFDVLVQPKDFNKNELRLHFTDIYSSPEPTFKQISIHDESRWLYFPDQKQNIDSELNFYFDAEVKNMIRVPLNDFLQFSENGFFDITIDNFIFSGALVVFIQNDNTYHRVPLIENIHFYRKNSTTLSFFIGYDENSGFDSPYNGFSPYDDKNAVYIYNMLLSVDKHNPAKLIDMKTETTINNIFIWHPVVGMHYHVPLKEIDIISEADPAKYNVTLDETDPNYDVKTPSNYVEKDKIWLKKNTFDYVPYYNPAVFPDVSDRIYYWGKSTDWSTFEVYQWTESPVPPSLWEDYVQEQQNNTEIDSYLKPSGNPIRVIYRRVNQSIEDNDTPVFSNYEKIDVNPKDILTFELLPSYSLDSNNILQKIPLRLFNNPRKDQIIPNNTLVNVYINGFFKGQSPAKSIISCVKLQPPEEVSLGDLYFVPDQGADGLWKGLEGKYVQWNGSNWIIRNVLDKNLLEPPTNPDINDLYYIPRVAVGDWTGLEGKYVEWNGTGWDEIPFKGNTFDGSETVDGLYYVPKAVGAWENLEGNYVEWRGTYWIIRNPINATSLPSSPNVGDLYKVSGIIYEWNGSSWITKTPIVSLDLVPPQTPYYDDLYYLPRPSGIVEGKQGKYIQKISTSWIIREIKSTTLSIPPKNKDIGDLYLVLGAKNQWSGKEGKYVEWDGSNWVEIILESDSLLTPPNSPNLGLYYIPDVGPKGDWNQFRGKYVKWDGENWIEVTEDEKQALEAQEMTNYPGGAYVDLSDLGLKINTVDTITIEFPLYQLEIETLFQSNNVEYIEFTPYTQLEFYDSNGITTATKYYFWVGNKITKSEPMKLSLREIGSMLKQPTEPYMFVEGFKPAGSPVNSPARFTQVIIRGISNQIFEENRFKIRFQYNNTLRDVENIKHSLTRKNVHEEWQLFRKNQPYKISKYLWDKLTESVVGYKLNDPTIPVPSYERVLYDQINGTATRIGLGEGQTFVDKQLALNTIITELQNPDFDLYPIDKSLFTETFKFDSPENIKIAMNEIYNTFAYSDVNRIFFACLHDALSLKKEYDGIMKTSTIALYGIKLLETINRVVDD